MDSRDTQETDVVVIVKDACEARIVEVLRQLQEVGFRICQEDPDTDLTQGAVAGTIETSRLPELERMDCVQYVRRVMSYMAEFPANDPRDRNGGMGGSPDDLPPPTYRGRVGKMYP